MTTVARKISPAISLLDETAEPGRSSGNRLQLLAGSGGFSFALLDESRNKFVALEAYNLQNVFQADSLSSTLTEIIQAHPFLKNKFDKVSFAYDSNRSTLVPEALFEPGKTANYLEFNHPADKQDLVFNDKLSNIGARNVFYVPSVLEKTILGFYPNARIHHPASALLEHLAMTYKNESKPQLVVHIALTHFEIILFEGKHLRFYNTFRHQTSEDFIYYLLFVYEQLKLNPETQELILIGEVERNSALYAILQKYVRNIRFGDRPDTYTYSHPLTTIPKHFYCSLFSQQLFE